MQLERDSRVINRLQLTMALIEWREAAAVGGIVVDIGQDLVVPSINGKFSVRCVK